jgi:hypothetical protein
LWSSALPEGFTLYIGKERGCGRKTSIHTRVLTITGLEVASRLHSWSIKNERARKNRLTTRSTTAPGVIICLSFATFAFCPVPVKPTHRQSRNHRTPRRGPFTQPHSPAPNAVQPSRPAETPPTLPNTRNHGAPPDPQNVAGSGLTPPNPAAYLDTLRLTGE